MHTTRTIGVRCRPARSGVALVALLLPLVLAACGGSTPSGSGATTSSGGGGGRTNGTTSSAPTTLPATTTMATTATTTTTTTTTTTVTLATVPMQTPTGGEFLSPSGNISCEVHPTLAYCQTLTPPQSVRLTANGTVVTRCSGEQCLGNHGLGTPTLYYGEATGVGPYRCVSAPTGVTCTANGKGFRIAKSGIVAVTAP